MESLDRFKMTGEIHDPETRESIILCLISSSIINYLTILVNINSVVCPRLAFVPPIRLARLNLKGVSPLLKISSILLCAALVKI